MRPGLPIPNELELAILNRLVLKGSLAATQISKLHVLSRKYTGVGCYVDFLVNSPNHEIEDQGIGLDDLILVPGIPNGMGAVLYCKGGQPECLEIFVYGDDLWDGRYENFSIASPA